jgi:hypothetical protein
MIEVVVASHGTEALPQATTALVDDDDQPFEVEVVVDFGMSSTSAAAAEVNNPLQPPPSAGGGSGPSPMLSQRSASTMNSHGPLLRGMSGKINTPAPAAGASSGEVDDDVSTVSNVHEGDHPINETPEEAQALQQLHNNNHNNNPDAPMNPDGTRGSQGNTLYDSFQQGLATTKSSLTTFGSTMYSMASQARAAVESYKDQYYTAQKLKKSNYWEARDLYPRMGWHDVQCGISGRAARDIASHFVQRWNHHRLSTGNTGYPILREITEDLNFSVCAKCQTDNIFETCSACPNCGHDLGPVNSFSAPDSPAFYPAPVDRYSFMIFECRFFIANKLPFRLHGDCPAVVTSIITQLSPSGMGKDLKKEAIDGEGTILDLNGPMSEWLAAFGLFPAIGDVVATINGKCVSQFNSNQIKRLIKRIRKGTSSTFPNAGETYTIGFRRHYLEVNNASSLLLF